MSYRGCYENPFLAAFQGLAHGLYSFMEHANQFVFFRYKGVHETVSAVLKSFTNEITLDGIIIEIVWL